MERCGRTAVAVTSSTDLTKEVSTIPRLHFPTLVQRLVLRMRSETGNRFTTIMASPYHGVSETISLLVLIFIGRTVGNLNMTVGKFGLIQDHPAGRSSCRANV